MSNIKNSDTYKDSTIQDTKRFKTVKTIVIAAISIIVIFVTFAVISAVQYKKKASKYMTSIDENAYLVYTESMKNLLVLEADITSYEAMQKNVSDLLKDIEELDNLNKNYFYIFGKFTSLSDTTEEVVGLGNAMSSDVYVDYEEYFNNVLELEIEYANLNSNYPMNTEDSEDRLDKFQDQNSKYNEFLITLNSIEIKKELSTSIQGYMITSVESLISYTNNITESIKNLIVINDKYLAMYPPINGNLHPKYLKAYNDASAGELNNLSNTYNNAKGEILNFNDIHAEVIFNFASKLTDRTSELNLKVAEVCQNVDKHDPISFHTGRFEYIRDIESSTQAESIKIVLTINEDYSFELTYNSTIDQIEYNFDILETMSINGILNKENYTCQMEADMKKEDIVNFKDIDMYERTITDKEQVTIEFKYGRYIVTIDETRYDLRKV